MRVSLIVLACILVLLVATHASAQGVQQTQLTQPRIVSANLVFIVIRMKYADPADIAFLFGGSVVQGSMYGGNGSNSGGSGNSSSSGNSSRGSNRGSSNSSGYGNRW